MPPADAPPVEVFQVRRPGLGGSGVLGSWGRPLRRLERRPHVLGQRLQLTLVIAGHVVQRLAMPCSKSSKGRISSSTTALESSRISGRASASFAVSVLSHVFRPGESRCGACSECVRALVVASVAGEIRVKAKKNRPTTFHTQVVILYTQLLPRAACALCHIFMGTLKGSHRRCWLPAGCRASR